MLPFKSSVKNLAASFPEGTTEDVAQACLGLALSYGVDQPDATIRMYGAKEALPLTHAFAQNIPMSTRLDESRKEYPLMMDDAPVEAMNEISWHERMVIWLIRNGADPWARVGGKDVLDIAATTGARTLFRELCRRTDGPGLGSIRGRSASTSGRRVPYTHLAALEGRVEWMDDLHELGWDPLALDKQKSSLLSWAGDEATLKKCLSYFPSLSNDEVEKIRLDWRARCTNGTLSPDGADKLLNVLMRGVRDEIQIDEHAIKTQAMIEDFLTAAMTRYTHGYTSRPAGYYWRNKPVQDGVNLISSSWEERCKAGKGARAGKWSVTAAAIWGAAVGERDDLAQQTLATTLRQVFAIKGESAVRKWMDEECRPGITNRALFALAFAGTWELYKQSNVKVDREFWETAFLGLPGKDKEKRLALGEEVVAMCDALVGKSPSKSTRDFLGRRWDELESIEPGLVDMRTVRGARTVQKLVGMGVASNLWLDRLQPTRHIAAIYNQYREAGKQPEGEARELIEAYCGLALAIASRETPQDYRDGRARDRRNSDRANAMDLMTRMLSMWYQWLPLPEQGTPYPLNTLGENHKTLDPSTPSTAMEWDSWLAQLHLQKSLEVDTSTVRTRSSPRM